MRRLLILLMLFWVPVCLADDLNTASRIAADGMRVQSQRLKIISQNIANAGISPSNKNQEPYRRKIPTIRSLEEGGSGVSTVTNDGVIEDQSEFMLKYDPHHPAADDRGMVKYPNVDITIEYADARRAELNLEANLRSFEITKNIQMQLINSLK